MQFFTRFAQHRGRNLAAKAAFALGAVLTVVESRSAEAQVPSEVGVWINHEGKGAVEIKPCGAALCGNIVWLRDTVNDQGQPLFDRRNPDETKRNRPICGLPVIGNVKRTAEGWDEGWIYNPEEGAQYDVAIRAAGDRLTVTGYKGIKLFSKTLIWTRAPADLERCEGAPASQTKAKPALAPPKVAAPKPSDDLAPAKKQAATSGPPTAAPAKAAVTGGAAVKKAPAKDAKAVAPAAKKPEAATTEAKKKAVPSDKKAATATAAKTPSATAPATKTATGQPAPTAPAQTAKKKPAATTAAASTKPATLPVPKPVAAKKPAAKPVPQKQTTDEADASSAAD